MMERQVNHMVRLVDDLMEVSRITRGKIELRKQRVDLAAVVGSAVETTRPLIDAAGHLLTVDLGGEPLELDADPVRLAQVFSNLLNNAAKYTANGGQITLRAERRGADVVVSVRDNGAGIRAEVLAACSICSSRASAATAARKAGSASVSRSRAASSSCTAAASRRAAPAWARQRVHRAPAVAARLTPRTRRVEPTRPPTRIAGQRILVVDDNVDAAESLGALLRCLGAEVMTVHDGPAALEALRTQKPAAAVLDIGMPGMDGYELARRVRAVPHGARPHVDRVDGLGQRRGPPPLARGRHRPSSRQARRPPRARGPARREVRAGRRASLTPVAGSPGRAAAVGLALDRSS